MPDYAAILHAAPAGYAPALEALVDLLTALEHGGAEGRSRSLAQIEDLLFTTGTDLLRQVFQDHLDARAARERAEYRARPGALVGADGVRRAKVETVTGHLVTRFGPVAISRLSFRGPGAGGLRPSDADHNLPAMSYSHGLQRLLVAFATEVSFDTALRLFAERATGQRIGKRAAHQMLAAAGADIEPFYQARRPDPGIGPGQVVVISADGSGIDMRPEARREGVGPEAGSVDPSPAGSLAVRERRGRKRMTEIALVAVTDPVRRDADAVMGPDPHPGPVPRDTWLTGSISLTVAAVIDTAFAEAMLTLRATTIAGDADEYWHYHLEQEQHRNHYVHYQQEDLELAA